MEAPVPIITKIKENNNIYTLKFSVESNSLVIDISEDETLPKIYYSSKYLMSDLINISDSFKLFDSFEKLMTEMKRLCDEKKIQIQKFKDAVDLVLSLDLNNALEIHLAIPQAKIDSEHVIASLCSTINELKKKIKFLESNQITKQDLENNLKSKDILLNEEEKKMVYDWILENMGIQDKTVQMTLLYKLSNDGDSATTFHSRCNKKGYTLTLVRTTRGFRCGGFTTQNWTSSGKFKKDINAFLFSLEYKEYYPSYDGTNAIYDADGYGPTFGMGHDLYISSNCCKNNSKCGFPSSYYGTRYRSLSGGVDIFKVNEIEVYKIEIV